MGQTLDKLWANPGQTRLAPLKADSVALLESLTNLWSKINCTASPHKSWFSPCTCSRAGTQPQLRLRHGTCAGTSSVDTRRCFGQGLPHHGGARGPRALAWIWSPIRSRDSTRCAYVVSSPSSISAATVTCACTHEFRDQTPQQPAQHSPPAMQTRSRSPRAFGRAHSAAAFPPLALSRLLNLLMLDGLSDIAQQRPSSLLGGVVDEKHRDVALRLEKERQLRADLVQPALQITLPEGQLLSRY